MGPAKAGRNWILRLGLYSMQSVRLNFLIALFTLAGTLAAATAKLPSRHQEFLAGPTSYLITKPERQAFAGLKTDEERDRFMDRFWEIRNPAPNTEQNEFKDEFYKRVEWANAHYGRYNASEGWRTDQGKTYILFGKPQTTSNFVADQQLHPIELWFYSNPGLTELPPFFYVLFFERDEISGYRFYHPLMDGPEKLMRDNAYTKKQAYRFLQGINAELAHCSLTLIPGEPIDTEGYSGSMESVQILNAIQGYRDMPSYVSLVQTRAARLERVTSRVVYDLAKTTITTLVAREQGENWLHWQIDINDPMQPKAKDGKVAYDIDARLYSHARLVFQRNDAPSFAAEASAEEGLKRRPFAYEDRMPVVAGIYRLVVSAKNRATGKLYEAAQQVRVADGKEPLVLSDLVVVNGGEPDARTRPFQFGGVRLFPSVGGKVHSSTGLRLLYEVRAGEPRPAGLDVEYVVGTVSTKFRKVYQDRLDLSRADAAGTLMTAKTLPIEELSPGSYQVVLRIKDPQTGALTARSATFTVVNAEQDPTPIVVSRGATQTPQWMAVSQYERALCWLAQDRPLEAVASLEASWKLNQNPVTRGLLQHLYERTGQKKALN
jgi:GWxTD domain-containing protein